MYLSDVIHIIERYDLAKQCNLYIIRSLVMYLSDVIHILL